MFFPVPRDEGKAPPDTCFTGMQGQLRRRAYGVVLGQSQLLWCREETIQSRPSRLPLCITLKIPRKVRSSIEFQPGFVIRLRTVPWVTIVRSTG